MQYKYIVHNSLLPIYLAWQIAPDSVNYNLGFSYQFENAGIVTLLPEKLQQLISLKAHLRQTFFIENENLVAIVHDELPADVNFFTATSADFTKLEETLVKQPHDLNSRSAIKLNIITLNDSKKCVVIFNIHHILVDATSLDNFVSDLNRLFTGGSVALETAEEYINSVKHQAALIVLPTEPALVDYMNEIKTIANEVEYPATNKRNCLHYIAVLPTDIKKSLTLLTEQQDFSLFNALLVAWGIFLVKMFNQENTLINYPVNVRTDKSIEGCFLNIVTFSLSIETSDTYLSLIDSFKSKLATLKQMSRFALNNTLKLESIPSFAYSSYSSPATLIIDYKSYVATTYAQIANSNFSVRYREKDGCLYFTCDVFSDLFPEYFSETILPRFFNYLNKLLENPEEKINTSDLTFSDEKQKLLCEFNNTQAPYPKDKTVHQLFEEQVKKTPDAIAVVYEKQQLTYSELNNFSNQLAQYIKDEYKKITNKELVPDTLIAICIERSLDMIIGIFGIIKAGAAYVPIDPEYPEERIAFILADTCSELVLTQASLQKKLSRLHNNKKLISLDTHIFRTKILRNLVTETSQNNLIYVIYTSGTTGTPKGVMIEHCSVINTLCSLYQVYNVENNKRATAYTNCVFDVSVSEIFTILINGGELHLLNHERKDINQLATYLNEKEINSVYLPPVILAMLPRIKYTALRTIIFAGEPCSQEVGKYWLNQCSLYNYYGPTETTIYTTGKKVTDRNINEIGFPIMNTKAYVLDKNMNHIPIGIIGELYITGIGLARGYLHQIEMTNKKFVINPFISKNDLVNEFCRLYKTGDLARYLPDGNLEYIGRNDFQIKINGCRIELSEIESILSTYPDIQQSTVLLKEKDKNKYLIGYYTARKELSEENIFSHLKQHLPEYMIPSILIYLEKMPLTINGKLDRKALPFPDLAVSQNYCPPTNPNELIVCHAFTHVLGLPKIGIHDDFFKLGGDSLKAIALLSNLQGDYHVHIADIFNLKTPHKISQKLYFIKNNLVTRLKNIKNIYRVPNNIINLSKAFHEKLAEYTALLNCLPSIFEEKSIKNVLLTGATGYLGCHLLNQLLKTTSYTLYLLVRANSATSAFQRIHEKYQFYFDESLSGLYDSRLFVLAADIEKSDLGISLIEYDMLTEKIDSIIHAAALTKHYGEYDKFHSANVQATNNLLKLSALTFLKDFHYISTISVFSDSVAMQTEQNLYTEDDLADKLSKQANAYIKTKYEGEKSVIQYLQYGVSGNIYRIGNLAFSTKNGGIQENKNDNAFIGRIRFFLDLKMVAKELSMEEISPVDLTAQAIVKLFDKEIPDDFIFHIFNQNKFDIAHFFTESTEFGVKSLSINKFIDKIVQHLDKSQHQTSLERFLLHQGWLDEERAMLKNIKILSNRTNVILEKLEFSWHNIDSHLFKKFLQQANLYHEVMKSHTITSFSKQKNRKQSK